MPDASEAPVLVAPLDEHNATLARNVHPPDWRPPTPAGRYNLVVIGAGTAGLVTAAGARGSGPGWPWWIAAGAADAAEPDSRR